MKSESRLLSVWAAALFLSGCAAPAKLAPKTTHPESERGRRVTEAPPPSEVEVLPVAKDKDCQWRDGYWDFRGHNWVWTPGLWVKAQSQCRWASPTIRWEQRETGLTLIYRPGTWYEGQEKPCETPPQSCVGPS